MCQAPPCKALGTLVSELRYGVLLSWKRQTPPKKTHTNKSRTAAVTDKVPQGGGDRAVNEEIYLVREVKGDSLRK